MGLMSPEVAAAKLAFTAKKTSAYVAKINETVLVDLATAAANVAVTLPSASPANTRCGVKLASACGAYSCTVTPAAGTIDGAASVVLTTDFEVVILQSDGTNWWRVG